MAEFDPSNPLGVITAFFGVLFTGIAFLLKFGMAFGFVGMLAGLGVFAGLLWSKNT